MNIANPVGSEITSVAFSVYRPDEVRRTSVRRIVNPQLLDNLGHPAKGGLYDPALGPYSKHHLWVLLSGAQFKFLKANAARPF
ncbi:MAG: hypothetical protein BJ554DRAFT_7803 [Olpidium bornovanus]|uniref:DNA-directed RNA polymerase n=1 Tax=Olpidium bornovanus TaxID=278681 RepID=A0A8H7ZVU7_9FUNG|nr:MAG: hypothetical protein BJ554DRAFT_7803 [Olpidium bornovanus]